MSTPESSKNQFVSPTPSIGEQSAATQSSGRDSVASVSDPKSSFSVNLNEDKETEKRNSGRVPLDSHGKPYCTDYMFHVAIYRSLSPSEGVAMNVLSTQEDIAYLKDHHVLPANRFI